MVTCADTSFLFSVYANDTHTSRAIRWLRGQDAPLVLTALNEFELGNALRFAEFRRGIGSGEAGVFWSQFEADRAAGRIVTQVCNLAAVLDEAKRLSSTHTLSGGHRGFDIMHAAGALVLGADRFLTFDRSQKRLAEAEGLEVPI